jgi:hypothetical protein
MAVGYKDIAAGSAKLHPRVNKPQNPAERFLPETEEANAQDDADRVGPGVRLFGHCCRIVK